MVVKFGLPIQQPLECYYNDPACTYDANGNYTGNIRWGYQLSGAPIMWDVAPIYHPPIIPIQPLPINPNTISNNPINTVNNNPNLSNYLNDILRYLNNL